MPKYALPIRSELLSHASPWKTSQKWTLTCITAALAAKVASNLRTPAIVQIASVIVSSFVVRLSFDVIEWCTAFETLKYACNPFDPAELEPIENNFRVDIEALFYHKIVPFKSVSAKRITLRSWIGSNWLRYRPWSPYTQVRLQDTLQIYMWAPKTLSECPRASVGLFSGHHGGGMVTGHPAYRPWLPTAIFEAAHRLGFVVVMAERRLGPECEGDDFNNDSEAYMDTIMKTGIVEDFLHSIDPRHKFDRTKVIVFAESAGAMFAVRELIRYPNQVHAMCLFSPLVGRRSQRKVGKYMGRPFTSRETEQCNDAILSSLQRLNGETPVAKSREPPLWMWAGPVTACSGNDIYNAQYAIDYLEEVRLSSDVIVRIMHSSDDELVPYTDTVRLLKAFREKGINCKLRDWGKLGHCPHRGFKLAQAEMEDVWNDIVKPMLSVVHREERA